MTVVELMDWLKSRPGNAEVVFANGRISIKAPGFTDTRIIKRKENVVNVLKTEPSHTCDNPDCIGYDPRK